METALSLQQPANCFQQEIKPVINISNSTQSPWVFLDITFKFPMRREPLISTILKPLIRWLPNYGLVLMPDMPEMAVRYVSINCMEAEK